MAIHPHACRTSPPAGSASRNPCRVTACASASRSRRDGAAARKRTTLVLAERKPTGAAVVPPTPAAVQPRVALVALALELQRVVAHLVRRRELCFPARARRRLDASAHGKCKRQNRRADVRALGLHRDRRAARIT